jgi:hypothetical protein
MDYNELLQGVKNWRNVATRNAATLNRQLSTLYYAMFHYICKSNADVLAGSSVSRSDWIRVYRALDHQKARKRCRMIANASHFDTDVQTFARLFERMQLMRLSADYDPDWNASDLMVGYSLVAVNQAIYYFDQTPEEVRRTFAIHLLFDQRL